MCNDKVIELGRRRFIKLAALGAGMTLVSALPGGKAKASGRAKAVLLSCMDYRLTDETLAFMLSQDLKNNYDHLVLAGASLSISSDKFPEWQKTFWDHLKLARELHHVEEVYVVDHRDCGAYKLVLGKEAVDTPEKETAVHTEYLKKFAALVREREPGLEVRAFLEALDGTVETIEV